MQPQKPSQSKAEPPKAKKDDAKVVAGAQTVPAEASDDKPVVRKTKPGEKYDLDLVALHPHEIKRGHTFFHPDIFENMDLDLDEELGIAKPEEKEVKAVARRKAKKLPRN